MLARCRVLMLVVDLDGLLIMKFVDGETCDRAKVNRMAIINFECDKNAGLVRHSLLTLCFLRS